MYYTKIKIFDMTLRNLDSNNLEENLELLKLYYEPAIKQVLKDFDWNFATSYRELALTGNISANPKFIYEYDYPNDCIFARELISYIDNKTIEFEVASNKTGQKVINTNLTPAILRYTRFVQNEMFFTTEFVIALCWYLSFLTCSLINSNDKKNQDFYIDKYNFIINKLRSK